MRATILGCVAIAACARGPSSPSSTAPAGSQPTPPAQAPSATGDEAAPAPAGTTDVVASPPLGATGPVEPAPPPASVDPAPPTATAPVDPAPPPPPARPVRLPKKLTFASVDALLDLAASEPPDQLSGFRLGDPPPSRTEVEISIPGWPGGWARALVSGGKVRHVIVDLLANSEDPRLPSGHAAIAAVEKRIRARWGAPGAGLRRSWRGAKAQLFVSEFPGSTRGIPSLVIDLLPPTDDHVCGAGDGFTAFFTQFRDALAAKDADAVTKLLEHPPDDGMPGCRDLSGKRLMSCLAPIHAKLEAQRAKPGCHLSQELYYWAALELGQSHGGQYFEFRRRDDGTWRVKGPFWVTWHDRLDLSGP